MRQIKSYIYQTEHDDETSWITDVCLSVHPSIRSSLRLSDNLSKNWDIWLNLAHVFLDTIRGLVLQMGKSENCHAHKVKLSAKWKTIKLHNQGIDYASNLVQGITASRGFYLTHLGKTSEALNFVKMAWKVLNHRHPSLLGEISHINNYCSNFNQI